MNKPTHSNEDQYDVTMLCFSNPNGLFQNLLEKEGSSNDTSAPPPNLQNLAHGSSIITQVQNSSPSTHPTPPSPTIRPEVTATITFRHAIPPL